jgi:hypothetical protein
MNGWVTGHRSLCESNDAQRTLHYCSTLLLRQSRCILIGDALFLFLFLGKQKKESKSAPQALGISTRSNAGDFLPRGCLPVWFPDQLP